MKQYELVSYIYDFISQLLDNKLIFEHVRKIILFGSIVRGDYNKKSDIDIFIDITNITEKEKINLSIKKEIHKFETRAEKTWFLRSINLPFKLIVDNIENEKWKELREEILNYGIIIYGKSEKTTNQLKHKILINYELNRVSQKRKMSFLRKMYGYIIKKEKKEYPQQGLIHRIDAKKIGSNALIVSANDWLNVKKLLKEEKVAYTVHDVWLT